MAREVLGGRRASSVFPCPTRQSLHADTYAEACDANERLIGKRLSRQAWGIAPKILEVDTFLRANEPARGRIREIHPEVLFWATNGRRPMQHHKARRAGVEERLFVLERFVPYIRNVYREAVSRHTQKKVAPDDILDALAAAVTGHFGGDALQTIPDNPPLDEHGLATEMVVWMPEEPSGGIHPDESEIAGLLPYVRSAPLAARIARPVTTPDRQRSLIHSPESPTGCCRPGL
jgi:predicted RNase H-like nuclease